MIKCTCHNTCQAGVKIEEYSMGFRLRAYDHEGDSAALINLDSETIKELIESLQVIYKKVLQNELGFDTVS